MVFSFFKKQPAQKKLPERPAARPRAPMPEVRVPPRVEPEVPPLSEPLPDLEFTISNVAPPVPPVELDQPTAAAPVAPSRPVQPIGLDFPMDDFDRDFTESSVMAIDVEHDVDPLQADIEQVVVLYANGQDAVARSLVESLLPAYPPAESRRLWLLLFDLLQVAGDRVAFDRRCVEYAETCEMSPPTWNPPADGATGALPSGGVFALHGVLTVDDAQQLAQFEHFLRQPGRLLLDCSRLAGCDDTVAGRLADALIAARRAGRPLEVTGADAFLGRLDDRLNVGEASHEPAWRLLLELLQRQGTQAQFEERAVDYAVTFELSPPSWENAGGGLAREVRPAPGGDACYLSGELKHQRFDELVPVLEAAAQPVLDFSGVRRLDFHSAGQLVNRLAPLKAAGKDVVIRSPNHLIAELMAVVGLNKQARIIVPKS